MHDETIPVNEHDVCGSLPSQDDEISDNDTSIDKEILEGPEEGRQKEHAFKTTAEEPDAGDPGQTSILQQTHLADKTDQSDSQDDSNSQSKGKWEVREVLSELDRHEYTYAYPLKFTKGKEVTIVGARVRGRLKKHHGLNCDDWFEVGSANGWTIIAVADGLGSKKLSRVGAKAACRGAVDKLKERLSSLTLRPRENAELWEEALNRDEDYVFFGEDVEMVSQALIEAIDNAYNGLVAQSEKRKGNQEYIELLGGEPTVNDFSTTLLIAIHATTLVENRIYDLVMSLQIGDGRIVAVHTGGGLTLLGKPDSGSYAAQVVPLTSGWIREHRELRQRIARTMGRLEVLMVMTDGVSEIFFPHATEMLNLYKELIQRGIVNINYSQGVVVNEANNQGEPQEILRDWLDTYEVRGEFDDRTLVVLYRESDE